MAEVSGIKWHIVPGGQRLTTVISQVGTGFTDVWEVTYEIDSGPAQGVQGTIKIPASQFNAETVKATVNELVSRQHGVASL